jgi:transcriptional regulator with XRE-family HTH domain
MIIGDRLRTLRETKNLSQGDIEQRSGLLRCYVSRVENGHTVPSVETLEKMARALEVPLHQIFYGGEEPLLLPNFPTRKKGDEVPWGTFGKDARILRNLRRLLKRVSASDLKLLVFIAQKMAQQTALRAKTE